MSEVDGPWNKEMVVQWMRAASPVARSLAETGPHIALTIVTGSLLCPPEALTMLGQVIHHTAARLQCIGNLVVAADGVEGRALFTPMYARIYTADTPHDLFPDYESGKAWALAVLAEKGF
ncbi:hypothetical protein C7C56_004430 [Massilia glaciei]|uniref:Uncharacterized protein n=1 Tax=Massilia glaciei TaxID=1524097 RepID=A0A2U2I5L9_9BURK|nr:hypothetical protein C7C56_004430 [Massilia glaciei]